MIPALNQGKVPQNLKSALYQLLIFTINFIGIFGVMLIIYSLLAWYYDENWAVIEWIVKKLSIFCTVVGTTITAFSIYLPMNDREPEPFSRFISAPIVIFFCLVVMFLVFIFGVAMPDHLLNGIAILGISGALFRLISRNIPNG